MVFIAMYLVIPDPGSFRDGPDLLHYIARLKYFFPVQIHGLCPHRPFITRFSVCKDTGLRIDECFLTDTI